MSANTVETVIEVFELFVLELEKSGETYLDELRSGLQEARAALSMS